MAASRVRRAFDAGGWFPALEIDGTAVDADEVFRTVARYLRRRGVSLEVQR